MDPDEENRAKLDVKRLMSTIKDVAQKPVEIEIINEYCFDIEKYK